MGVHKLTAGDGYTYLTRQVAAFDATERGYANLGSYYSEKGEAPGVWMGRGLSAATALDGGHCVGGVVTEPQMVALFGEGRHPDADAIETAARAAGASERAIDRASRLGRAYPTHDTPNLFRRQLAGAYRDHNNAAGRPEDTPIPDEVRARIRTDLATTLFAKEMGRPPADARELSGYLARSSRQATTAVAGYDLTFSPVKSVSTLWAIAPLEVAREIEQAHQDAVADTLAWLEDHAAYTRRGRHGIAQVDVHGLIAAAFTHRDTRAGDPDLHTHVAISNKVQALDGTWLALDGRMIYRNNVAASERYNTRLEANLRERLGLRFGPRSATGNSREPGRRAVREVVGIDGPLPASWSTRRASIEARRADLSTKFQADHGRPPTAKEAIGLAQQANLQTRHAKHEPRSHAQQRQVWRAEAAVILGGHEAVDAYVAAALRTATASDLSPTIVGVDALSRWAEKEAAAVLATVQTSRATWQEHHLRAEAERRARDANLNTAVLDEAVELLVSAAKTAPSVVQLGGHEDIATVLGEPTLLRRSDGTSVYDVAGSTVYTTTSVMEAEGLILAAAARTDGAKAERMAVEVAIVESAANGVALNPSQGDLVRELATSGRRVQLALAPAGTGKTAALRVLAHAWAAGTPAQTDGVSVVGLAPSAAAAAVLREQIGADVDTLAKLIHTLDHPEAPTPQWMRRIGPGTLVVVDEAGMAGTLDLARAVEHALTQGASVRLIGDDQQLGAVGAGGILRDIATTCGAVSLSQVMRFTHPTGHPRAGTPNHAEAAASLALRDGNPAAIGYYLDHGRVHVGDLATVTDQAYTAWKADRAHGVDAVMLAPTRDLVAHLNTRARADRLAQTPATEIGLEVALADESRVSAGDEVITRRNNRRIPLGTSDWVKNGDRWTVSRVHPGGALDVYHRRTGRHVTLPAGYVAEYVELGYATTVHGAQGVTADTAYTVATGTESRQLLYVALTRGRHANHVYLTTAGDGDPHSVITREALLPPTAVDILTAVIARDDTPTSATSTTADLADPARLLSQDAAQYHHALTVAAEDLIGAEGRARIDATLRLLAPATIDTPAHPALRSHLALLAADGHDIEDALAATLERVGLAGSRDAAAVLDWRLTPSHTNDSRPDESNDGGVGPLPWLPAIPARLAAHPQWGPYLARRDALTRDHARTVNDAALQWTPTTAPPWAAHLIDRDTNLVGDLAVWRAANDVPDTDVKPTGPAVLPAADAAAQHALDQRVNSLLAASGQNTHDWAPLAASIDPRILLDPHWPALADQLAAARRAGIDITTLARAEGARRPLPDEQPAAALWWRLSEHLTPGALTHATTNSGGNTLRPEWTADLTAELGDDLARRVTQDPAWPALVAAVTLATADGWTPAQVLAAAHDLLRGGQDPDARLRPDELAQALVWRVALLTDSPTEPTTASASGGQPERSLDTRNSDLVAADAGADTNLAEVARRNETTPAPNNRAGEPLEIWVGSGEPTEQISEARVAAILEEWNRWDHAPVSRQRILQLNEQAADYYQACYSKSWAPAYLQERLGNTAAAQLDARTDIRVGYAPPSWTALTNHLRKSGATDEEIIAAGLGTRASHGHLIDRFRDRLMFPINHGEEIHGFIGRRNPTKDNDEHAGPKYLNTPETDLFRKREVLYGLEHATDTTDALVLVEGPLDALAVTLGTAGTAVGVAPLGTAFTDVQADRLTHHATGQAVEVLVGFDNDNAGQAATARAYWELAVHNVAPRHLLMPAGFDPAQLLQHQSSHDLHTAIATAPNLASTLIQQSLEAISTQSGSARPSSREDLNQAVVIAASAPIAQQAQHLGQIAQRSGADLDAVAQQLIDARTRWAEDPDRVAANAVAPQPHEGPHASTEMAGRRSRRDQVRGADPRQMPSQSPVVGAENPTTHKSPAS